MSNLSSQLLAVDFSELGDKIFPNTETHIIEWGGSSLTTACSPGSWSSLRCFWQHSSSALRSFAIGRRSRPGFQMFLEWLVAFFDKSADEMTEEYGGLMGPYTLGAAAYICCGVLIEMFGLRPAMGRPRRMPGSRSVYLPVHPYARVCQKQGAAAEALYQSH